jgi:hypothetical protein
LAVALEFGGFGFLGVVTVDFESDFPADPSAEGAGLAGDPESESSASAPALPGVVDVTAPPDESTFIPPDEPAEPTEASDSPDDPP